MAGTESAPGGTGTEAPSDRAGTQPEPGATDKPDADQPNRGIVKLVGNFLSRIKRGAGNILSKPWWAGISAIAAVLAIGGTVAAVLAILPSDQPARKNASPAVIRFSHVSKITIRRFGLVFSYPSYWDLQHVSAHSNHVEFINPNDTGVSITGYGTNGRLPNLLEYYFETRAVKSLHVIGPAAQSGTFVEGAAGKYPVNGLRYLVQIVDRHGHALTFLVKVAVANGREVALIMGAPTREFPRYKEEFLELSNEILLLKKCGECSGR